MGKKSKYSGLSRESKLDLMRRDAEQELLLMQALQKRNFRNRPFRGMLVPLWEAQPRNEKKPKGIVELVQTLSARLPESKRIFFKEMLAQLEEQNCKKMLADAQYIQAIFNLARFSGYAVKKPEGWRNPSYNVNKQFASLARFCFAKYELPLFMDKAWFSGNETHILWFIKIAQGENLRNCDALPLNVTKKMTHHFMHAPEQMTINEALRWAQVQGWGGDERLANMIVAGALGRNNFEREDFWEKAIQFFAKDWMLSANRLNQLIDFLQSKCRRNEEFSFKGRTIKSLLKLTDEWHAAMWRERRSGKLTWTRCTTIRKYSVAEGKGEQARMYSIHELLSSKELLDEGRKMSHCVAGYDYDCFKRKIAIFSMRSFDKLKQEAWEATIEVHLESRKIVQAKARFNKPLTPVADRVMKKWAANEQLSITEYL